MMDPGQKKRLLAKYKEQTLTLSEAKLLLEALEADYRAAVKADDAMMVIATMMLVGNVGAYLECKKEERRGAEGKGS